MEKIIDFCLNKIPNFINNLQTYDLYLLATEFVLFSIVFFFTYNFLSKNHAIKVSLIIFLLVIFTGCFCVILDGNSIIYLIFIALLFVSVILLFATEIKRLIWNTKKSKKISNNTLVTVKSNATAVNKTINEIIKALQNMSKNDVGAIIVLANTKMPENIIDSGVRINSTITSALIESIFFPKTPLHDGAMIIEGDKIQSAGCFLPLSQQTDLPKGLGTRHRAGIGITETINVTSIIVSEETGIISYAQAGKITRYADSEMLRKLLKEYYWQDFIGVK